MGALPVGARTGADVRRGRLHPEPALGQRVLDGERERERVARLRVEHVLEDGAAGLLLPDRPAHPADEAVDRVVRLWLTQWKLIRAPVELVAPVLDPVRPGDQELPPGGAAHPVGGVAVEEVGAAGGVGAQAAADLDDHRPLVVGHELDLPPRRRRRGHQSLRAMICEAAQSAIGGYGGAAALCAPKASRLSGCGYPRNTLS